MIPTVIDDDREAAAAINRRTLSGYVALPNYRNYWKAAGYEEEMTAIEDALAAGKRDKVATFMTDKWLSDCTLLWLRRRGARRRGRLVRRRGEDTDRRDVVDEGRAVRRAAGALRRLLVGAERRARAHEVAIALRAVDAADRRPVLRAPQRRHRVGGTRPRIRVRPLVGGDLLRGVRRVRQRVVRTIERAGSRPALISSRIATIASQNRSISSRFSLSVGSTMSVPATGNDIVGAWMP